MQMGSNTKFEKVKQKQKIASGVTILISDKIDLKIKKITRDKEGRYIMIKGSIQGKDITIVNIYAPNIEAPQYIRQTLLLLLLLSRFSCVRLCATPYSSPPGSPIPGILQARTLEWVAISFSNA